MRYYLTNILVNYQENPKNLHTQSICFNRDNTWKINLEFLTSIVIHSFCISFRRVPMRSCHHQWNIGPPWKSCDKELLWDSRERSFRETGKTKLECVKGNPKIYREKQNEKRTTQAREKRTLQFFRFLGDYSLFGRVIKILMFNSIDSQTPYSR